MDEAPIVDAEVVPEEQSPGTDVAVVEQSAVPTNLFRTKDPVAVIAEATAVADALKDVLRSRNMIECIQGKDHVKVEGWQLCGSMLGVSAVCVETEEIEGGFKATVEARTLDGRVIGRASAICTKNEKRGPWKSAEPYAILSMAQTRATSKALKGPLGFIINLAGYATTPAEEMTGDEQRPFGPHIDTQTTEQAARATSYLMDHRALLTAELYKAVEKECGYFPRVVGRAFLRAAFLLKEDREKREAQQADLSEPGVPGNDDDRHETIHNDDQPEEGTT